MNAASAAEFIGAILSMVIFGALCAYPFRRGFEFSRNISLAIGIAIFTPIAAALYTYNSGSDFIDSLTIHGRAGLVAYLVSVWTGHAKIFRSMNFMWLWRVLLWSAFAVSASAGATMIFMSAKETYQPHAPFFFGCLSLFIAYGIWRAATKIGKNSGA